MKKKYGFLMSAVLAAGTLLSGCGSADNNEGTQNEGGGEGNKNDFKVAMVTDVGGVDDKSFNQSAWEGLQKFGKDNNLEEGKDYKYVQSTAASDYQPNLSGLIRDGYDLVYGIGFLMQQDIQTVAQQKKDAQLALVDSVAVNENGEPLENVASITFKEHQGSFLVGLIAGMQTKSNKVGFVGGVTSELIKKFENGFKAGVKTVNPDAEIYVQYAEDFASSEKGQAIANTMYGKGADVIYHAAGATGNGVFTEAKNRAKNGEEVWVIGVDRDQHEEGMPENVTLTSMVKRVDTAVYEVSKQTMEGNFPGGKVTEFGLEEDGVGIAETKDNVSEDALKKVDEYKEKIKNGEVEVPKTDEEYETYVSSL
ncbi:BMP family lipoprotein [Pseudalkalibacillus caeni]|uniref:BMP family ABC transporter substrate-binding protein n=1 Tax=Exobacillus caeni TaxID=2574798 RepID=A0A5R9F1F2_9BACL|nr:BMP family protein [Pseudalkalibacillus caeni]TLS37387.1 BMP family ABC transporter substrate-binding protein [Pseudalkalibacillus caeni]